MMYERGMFHLPNPHNAHYLFILYIQGFPYNFFNAKIAHYIIHYFTFLLISTAPTTLVDPVPSPAQLVPATPGLILVPIYLIVVVCSS